MNEVKTPDIKRERFGEGEALESLILTKVVIKGDQYFRSERKYRLFAIFLLVGDTYLLITIDF